jgi:hypothetical protein
MPNLTVGNMRALLARDPRRDPRHPPRPHDDYSVGSPTIGVPTLTAIEE